MSNNHIFLIRNNIPLIIDYIDDPKTFATTALVCKYFAEVTQDANIQNKAKAKFLNKSICKWRVYCITECEYQYTWVSQKPVLCPNDKTHIIDKSSQCIFSYVP